MNIELNPHSLANANYQRQSPAQTATTNLSPAQHQPVLEEMLDIQQSEDPPEKRGTDSEGESTSPELLVIRSFSNLVSPSPAAAEPADKLNLEA